MKRVCVVKEIDSTDLLVVNIAHFVSFPKRNVIDHTSSSAPQIQDLSGGTSGGLDSITSLRVGNFAGLTAILAISNIRN